MTMSASAQVFKIDNVDIYSFGTLESLREFVSSQKLTVNESKTTTKQTVEDNLNLKQQPRYNTRRSKLKRCLPPPPETSSFSPSSSPSSSYEMDKCIYFKT